MTSDSRLKPKLYTPQMAYALGYEEAKMVYENKINGRTSGPYIWLPLLREELGSVLPEGLTLVHAPPGCGKTAFAQHLAAMSDCPVIFLTCEMTTRELVWRDIARANQIYISKIQRGEISPGEWLEPAKRMIEESKVYYLDATQSPASIEDILEAIDVVREAHEDEKFLLVVDSVSSWIRSTNTNTKSQEHEIYSEGTMQLQNIAAFHNISILGIVEQNRSHRDKNAMEAMAGSRSLEYTAQVVLSLTKNNKEWQIDQNGRKIISAIGIDLQISKNRFGAGYGKISLRFFGGFMLFEEDNPEQSQVISLKDISQYTKDKD